ncbi:23S rRNA (uracil(1939)-C(5))-methyltransferase RlmD [Fuchsiella alkaliacetigena]|uniref:23S rRNA (uracil(1939)-C(5))-methyltransferase RlmD n=1 Tax=Fuchsiella alkaliacetigena TaxID=957042 RepID=UPI00200A6097|nr:23S rRNA (uracil(1939)-C(5))-methyltransferase RlmD [Fuchsiella alkaliacetigena]MCK8825114.1 23S rRNA (uracil(1939)-C(5))-methyltransferase RlmD [Fuchsiella alkaliacetigena]
MINTKPVTLGDKVVIELENLAYGGEVVGRKDGFAVFVTEGVPGEKVKAQVTQVKNNYARAEIVELLESDSERVEGQCVVNSDCGGCQLQHIDYQAQLKYKQQLVKDALERIAKLPQVEVKEVIGMENPYFYRNKAQFSVTERDEELIAGFYAAGTHQVVDFEDCLIQHQLINRVKREAVQLLADSPLSVYDPVTGEGLLKNLVIRVGVCTNQAMLLWVTNERESYLLKELSEQLLKRVPELISVHQNINREQTSVVLGAETILLAGEAQITDYIGEVMYRISPESFFQVNTLQAKELYEQILEQADLTGDEVVVDAYCGLGSISLYVAAYCEQVYGIELNFQAIEDARENARLNGIENVQFRGGETSEILPQLISEGVEAEVLIVDPPRKGCHPEVLNSVQELGPAKIIYVSCDPSSLARDLKKLTTLGYQVKEVQPVDMFPQTYHIETVTILELA